MSTDELIDSLVRDSRPVVRSLRPGAQLAEWTAIGMLYLAVYVLIIGTREDLDKMWYEAGFVIHTLIVLGVTVLAASAAFKVSIPDQQHRLLSRTTTIGLAGWLAWIVSALVTASELHAGWGWKCLRNIIVLSVPLGALSYYMMSKAAPLRARAAGWLAALSAAAAADLATRFICRNDHGLHALIWHFLPTLMLGGSGVMVGRLVFRWDAPRKA